MSQIVTRENISELESMPFSRVSNTVSAASLMMSAVSSMTDTAIREFFTGSVNMKHTTLSNLSDKMELRSPNSLRSDFLHSCTANLSALSIETVTPLTKQKVAVMKTILQTEYLIQDKNAVQEKLHHVINADAKTMKKSVENLMNEIQLQHSTVFSQQLQHIVEKASAEAGFKNVTVRIKNAVPIITALNENGQGIVSEIRTNNKTKVIDLVSETTDFYEGECNQAMNDFGEALKKYGVKFTNANRKWTGGNCWLPSAQQVQNETKQKKANKELDRIRQLNKQTKIKN
jgi:hypothetical protein